MYADLAIWDLSVPPPLLTLDCTNKHTNSVKSNPMKICRAIAPAVIVCIGFLTHGVSADIVLTGVFDGPLSGGVPKAIELYVTSDIADLGEYGVGSANNGGGSDGQEFTLSGSATAGDYIYIASETPNFNAYFGFDPTFTAGAMSINGDDAIELFFQGNVSDVYGDINTDGSGEPWDYLDGWAYRLDNTGPDGSTFVIGNWDISGVNVNDGQTSNGTASNPWPIGTYSFSAVPEPGSLGVIGLVGLAGFIRRRR